MPNTKPVGVAFSDPELVSGTTISGAAISGGTTLDSTSKVASNIASGLSMSQQGDDCRYYRRHERCLHDRTGCGRADFGVVFGR